MTTALRPTRTRRQPVSRTTPVRDTNLKNVSDLERILSVAGGSALALYGLSRGTLGGVALALGATGLVCRGVAGHCYVYQALGINTAESRGPRTSIPATQGVKLEKTITINRSPEDLYRFWRNFSNLPRFMTHLKSVQVTGPNRSHWVAEGPMGMSAEWDAEIITQRENELIGWRSLPGSSIDTAGSVHFKRAPGGRGTEVRVSLKYDPPAGKLGAAVAWMFGESGAQQVEEDLRHFKQVMETGEIPTTQGQPKGTCC